MPPSFAAIGRVGLPITGTDGVFSHRLPVWVKHGPAVSIKYITLPSAHAWRHARGRCVHRRLVDRRCCRCVYHRLWWRRPEQRSRQRGAQNETGQSPKRAAAVMKMATPSGRWCGRQNRQGYHECKKYFFHYVSPFQYEKALCLRRANGSFSVLKTFPAR